MKTKMIVNNEGEQQAVRVEIPIEGGGGELGQHAVTNLVALIGGLKDMETEEDLKTHFYMICGYASCCMNCGFMTEKSTDDVMHLAEHLAENEYIRLAGKTSAGNI